MTPERKAAIMMMPPLWSLRRRRSTLNHQHATPWVACWFFAYCLLTPSPAADRADLGLGKVAPPAPSSPLAEGLAHYASALCLESETFIREALPHYRAVLKADPSNTELAYYVAELALNYADRPTALKLLEEGVAQHPELPGTWLNLAKFLATFLSSDPFEKDRAAEVLAQALQHFPRSAEVCQEAVLHELRQNQRPRAMKLLDTASSQPVSEPAYWLTLGRVAQEVWPLAHPELRDEHRKKVNPFFVKALALSQTQPQLETLQAVAQYYLVSNQLPQATVVAEQLVKQHRVPASLRLLARLYESGERADDAWPLLEELLKLEPSDVETHRHLLAHYVEARSYESALPHAEALVQYSGGRSQDYLTLGHVLLQCRKLDPALQIARRAITLFPSSAQFHLLAADCNRLLRRIPEARQSFEKAEVLAKSMQPELLDSAFYSNWADLLQGAQAFDEATQKYKRAIDLVPESEPLRAASILNNLGYMWLEQKRNLDQAGTFISKAVELEPNNPVYLDSLGWFHFLKADYPKALQVLLDVEKRIPADQADAEIFDHIGQVYEKLKDRSKAEDYYRRALKLDPDNEGTQQRLQALLGRAGL